MKALYTSLLVLSALAPAVSAIAGPQGSSGGRSITVDATGAVYTTGNFYGTVDFDPGPDSAKLTASGEGMYISKLDASGAFVWVKAIIGGSAGARPGGVALNAAGQLYVTGEFFGTQDFDPGAGVVNMTSPIANGFGDYGQAFIIKLDTSGTLIWAKNFGGTGGETISRDPAFDANGNVYLTGSFHGTADFDPGAGIFNITGGTFNNTTSADAYISSLDAAGSFRWAKSFGGANEQTGISVAVSASGAVYSTGIFQGTIDLDPGAGTVSVTAANRDMYISRLDTAGNYVWGKVITGYQNVGSIYARAMINADAAGNLIITGGFSQATDFDPGPGTTTLTPLTGGTTTLDVFILKLDAAGTFVWVKSLGGADLDQVFDAVLDAAGNIYATGYFLGTSDFDPDAGTTNLNSGSYADMYVVKLMAAGGLNWAVQIGDTVSAIGIAIDAAGDSYLTGRFASTVDFDPGIGVASLETGGGTPLPFGGTPQDAFVMKLTPGGSFIWARKLGTGGVSAVNGAGGTGLSNPPAGALKWTLAPNPVTDMFTIRSSQPLQRAVVAVINMQGQEVACWTGLNGDSFNLDVRGLAAGTYTVAVKSGQGNVQHLRIVKQ